MKTQLLIIYHFKSHPFLQLQCSVPGFSLCQKLLRMYYFVHYYCNGHGMVAQRLALFSHSNQVPGLNLSVSWGMFCSPHAKNMLIRSNGYSKLLMNVSLNGYLFLCGSSVIDWQPVQVVSPFLPDVIWVWLPPTNHLQ